MHELHEFACPSRFPGLYEVSMPMIHDAFWVPDLWVRVMHILLPTPHQWLLSGDAG